MKTSNNILHIYKVKKDIGQHIKEVRKLSGISVAEFARRINKTPQNVNDIFGRSSIDTSLLMNIGSVLNHDFFQYFISENKIVNAEVKSHRVTIQLEVSNEHIADKIIQMVVGNEGLRHLKSN